MMFNIRRESCAGTWQVNRTAVALIGGVCNGELISQALLGETPFWLDTLPIWAQTLSNRYANQPGSPWLVPAFTTMVASTYWARIAYMISSHGFDQNDIKYLAKNESITSTTSTLAAKPSLYCYLLPSHC